MRFYEAIFQALFHSNDRFEAQLGFAISTFWLTPPAKCERNLGKIIATNPPWSPPETVVKSFRELAPNPL